MRAVFISGWATGSDVWRRVGIPGFQTDHLSWVDLMHGEYELPDKCILVGWSLGGQLAMDLTSIPGVKGLVLVSSTTCLTRTEERPGLPRSECDRISAMLRKSRGGYLKSFFMACGARGEALDILLRESDTFSHDDLTAGLAVMFNHVAAPEPLVPARIVHGTEDGIVPFEVTGHLAGKVLGNARVIPVPGAGHLLPLQNPEAVERAVIDIACHLASM